jgi:tRNA A37 N6-isopentenylltransferase MiaA
LVTDFAVCARNPDRYAKRQSAWFEHPSSGAGQRMP